MESGAREVIQGNIAPKGQIERRHPPSSSGVSWQQFQSSKGHGGVFTWGQPEPDMGRRGHF